MNLQRYDKNINVSRRQFLNSLDLHIYILTADGVKWF